MAKAWRVFCQDMGNTPHKRPGPAREFGIDYPTLTDARFAKNCYQINYPHHKYFIRCATVNGWPDMGWPARARTHAAGEKVRLLAVSRPISYLHLAIVRPF
jgi:hypothetical protein